MDTLTRLLLLTTLGCVEIVPVEPVVPAAAPSARRREMQYASGAGTPLVFAAVPLHAPMPVVRVLSPAPLRARRHPALAPAPHDADYEEEPRPTRPTKQRARPLYHQDSDYEESYHSPRQTAPPTPPAPLITHRPSRLRPQVAQYEDEYDSYAPQPSYAASSSYVHSQPTYSYSTSYAATAPAAYPSAPAYAPQPAVYASVAQPQYEAVYAGSSSEPAPALLYARPSPSGGYTYRKIAPRTTTPLPVKPTKESPYIIKIHKYRITKS